MHGMGLARRSSQELAEEAESLAHTVTPEELAEFKQTFAIVDADGSGTISMNELQQLMQNLRQAPVQRAEVALIQEQIDNDKNDSISLDEFVQALTRWSASSKGIIKKRASSTGAPGSPGSPRRRTRSGSAELVDFQNVGQTREDILRNIKAFFNQFEEVDWNTKLQRVKEKFQHFEGSQKSSVEESMDSFWLMGREPNIVDANTRIQYIEQVRGEIQNGNLNRNIQTLKVGQTMELKIEALRYVQQVMTILDVFPSPSDRYDVAEVIFELFNEIQRGDVVQSMTTHFLGLSPVESGYDPNVLWTVQGMALDFLFLYLPGPRIAHTPPANVWHPDQMTAKKDALRATLHGTTFNCVQLIVALLTQTAQICALNYWRVDAATMVVKKCVQVLGAFAAHDEEARANLVELGILKVIIESLNPRQDLGARSSGGMHPEVAASLMWSLCILCGHTHQERVWELGGQAFKALFESGVWVRLMQIIDTCNPQGTNNHLPTIFSKPLPFAGEKLNSCISQCVTCCFIGCTQLYPGLWQEVQGNRVNKLMERGLQYMAICADVIVSLEDQGDEGGHNLGQRSDLMRCVLSAIMCVESIIVVNEKAAELLRQSRVADVVKFMLESQAHISLKTAAAGLLTKMCHGGLKKNVMESKGLVRLILSMVQNDRDLQNRMAALLHRLCKSANDRELRMIIRLGVIDTLFACLAKFEDHDEVSHKALGHSGVVFNFALVKHSLETLIVIARGCKDSGVHEIVEKFTTNHCNALGTLLDTIVREIRQHTQQRWALAQGVTGLDDSIESKCLSLMQVLVGIHQPRAHQGNRFSAEFLRKLDPMQHMLSNMLNAVQRQGESGLMDMDGGLMMPGMMQPGMPLGNQMIPCNIIWNVDGRPHPPQQIQPIASNMHIMNLKQHITMNSPSGGGVGQIQFHDKTRAPPVWIELSTQNELQSAINGALTSYQPIELQVMCVSRGRGGQGGYNSWGGGSGGGFNAPNAFGGNLNSTMKSLRRQTDEGVLNNLWREFKQSAVNNGEQGISRREFQEILSNTQMGRNRKFCQQLFESMDTDNGGSVDIKELAMAWSIMYPSPQTKMRIMFEAFDFDNGGSLDPNELTCMIKMIQNIPHYEAEQMAQRIFQMADQDGSGDIDFQEMYNAMNNIPECQQLLMRFNMS